MNTKNRHRILLFTIFIIYIFYFSFKAYTPRAHAQFWNILLPPLPPPIVLAPPAFISPIIAEQAGAWLGTWYLGFLWGDMSLTLVENPLTGYLSGTVTMPGNIAFGLSTPFPPVEVFGTATGGSIAVSGIDPSGLYGVSINGILTSPTEMSGTWSVVKVSTGLLVKNGSGSFELTLANAPTILDPVVAVPPPVPTVTVPTAVTPLSTAPLPTIPVPTIPVATTPVPIIPTPVLSIPAATTGILIPPTAVISGLFWLF